MVLNSIEKLLEKYDQGLTSLEEENRLREYFAKEEVAPHLEAYRPMFNYFANTQKELFTKDVPFKKNKSELYKWISVAAIAIIMLGVILDPFGGTAPTEQEKAEALYAYHQTIQAFGLVSNQLNDGKAKLSPINDLHQNLNEGMQKANLINEFTETTNIIYNTSNN